MTGPVLREERKRGHSPEARTGIDKNWNVEGKGRGMGRSEVCTNYMKFNARAHNHGCLRSAHFTVQLWKEIMF
jgi:hypothetical protein